MLIVPSGSSLVVALTSTAGDAVDAVCAFAVSNGGSYFQEGCGLGSPQSATEVTLVSDPGSGKVAVVRSILLNNKDSVARKVVVSIATGATRVIAAQVSVSPGDSVDALNLSSFQSGGSANWGAIAGTLSNQTDLQTALNAKASTDHDATHAPGGSDALPWTTIHGRGATGSKPAASSVNAGYLYYDTTLSQLERSNGTSWDVLTTSGGSGSGGSWALSSLVTLSADQTTNLAAGDPIRFNTISGDHTLSNYRVKIKGGQKAYLQASLRPSVNAGSTYANFQFYDVTNGAYVGLGSGWLPSSYSTAYTNIVQPYALVTPSSDTEYELRVTGTNGTVSSIQSMFSGVLVFSTLTNASQDIITATKVRMYYDSATGEYGPQQKITNRTGAATVKGTIVEASSSYDMAFAVCDANGDHPIGVVYEAGVADGSDAWVWSVGAICQVLLVNSTAATRGYWAQTGSVAGRADITNATPNSSTHWSEIGHCLESKTAGTNVLAKITLHFN